MDNSVEDEVLDESEERGTDSQEEGPEWSEVVDRIIYRQGRIKTGEDIYGFSWGIPALDSHITLQPSKLYIVAGIKKCGKSQFVLSTVLHNLRQDPPVHCGIFSLEGSPEETGKKILSHVSGINSRKIFSDQLGDKEFAALTAHAEVARGFPLFMDDRAYLNAYEVYVKAYDWKKRYGVPDDRYLIVVDFLQNLNLDRRDGETEATAIKNAAYELAHMAKELRCVVIATAQLSNRAEGVEPHIGHIEGSGGIAQSAEAILLLDLLHRRDHRCDNKKDIKRLNLIIAAQRTGESNVMIKCKADLSIGRFTAVGKAVEGEA